jgi:hypothetical protein
VARSVAELEFKLLHRFTFRLVTAWSNSEEPIAAGLFGMKSALCWADPRDVPRRPREKPHGLGTWYDLLPDSIVQGRVTQCLCSARRGLPGMTWPSYGKLYQAALGRDYRMAAMLAIGWVAPFDPCQSAAILVLALHLDVLAVPRICRHVSPTSLQTAPCPRHDDQIA